MSSLNTSISSLSSDLIQLDMIKKLVVLIVGLIVLLMGVIGNVINMIVFVKLSYYKENPCSLYILCRSFVDLLIVIIGLGTRILSESFEIDLTSRNDIWCRIRVPLIYINTLSSYTYLCFQSIDIYFITSLSNRIRRLSDIRLARLMILFTILIWILEEIPYLFNHQLELNLKEKKWKCLSTNIIYTRYRIYFVYLFLTTILPIIILILFDVLIYLNIRKYVLGNRLNSLSLLTKQMTRMTLFHLFCVLIFQSPFALSQIYFLTRTISSNPFYESQQLIIQQFFNILGYGIYSVSHFLLPIVKKNCLFR